MCICQGKRKSQYGVGLDGYISKGCQISYLILKSGKLHVITQDKLCARNTLLTFGLPWECILL